MDLFKLFAVLVYYGLWALLFALPNSLITEQGYSQTGQPLGNLSTPFTQSEVQPSGIFGTSIDWGRFFSLTFTGFGMPSDTPQTIKTIVIIWSIIMLGLSIGLILSAFWNG